MTMIYTEDINQKLCHEEWYCAVESLTRQGTSINQNNDVIGNFYLMLMKEINVSSTMSIFYFKSTLL